MGLLPGQLGKVGKKTKNIRFCSGAIFKSHTVLDPRSRTQIVKVAFTLKRQKS